MDQVKMEKEQLGSVIEMMRDDMIEAHAEMTASTEHLLAVLDAFEAALARAEGVEALRRFAERCAERDHQPDEHIGDAKCIACEAEGALRAAKGGEA